MKGLGKEREATVVRTVLFRLSADSVEIVGMAAMVACYEEGKVSTVQRTDQDC